jgi:hypothetical protein
MIKCGSIQQAQSYAHHPGLTEDVVEKQAIRLERLEAICANGHRFTFHVLSDFAYGWRDATTPNPEDFAYLDCFAGSFFQDLNLLIKRILRNSGKPVWESTKCFDLALPVACDPAPSGHRYSFSTTIWCPVCASTQVKSHDTNIVDTVSILQVTHNNWERLSMTQKRVLVEAILKEAGYL